MSLLLDALKNAENDKRETSDTDDLSTDNETNDDYQVNIEQAASPHFDHDAPQSIDSREHNSAFIVDRRSYTANHSENTDSNEDGYAHIDSLSGPSADVEPPVAKAQDPEHSSKSGPNLNWDLPDNSVSPEDSKLIESEKVCELNYTNDAALNESPQHFHYAQPAAKNKKKSILLIIFILAGTVGGTLILYMLNQNTTQQPLFNTNSSQGPLHNKPKDKMVEARKKQILRHNNSSTESKGSASKTEPIKVASKLRLSSLDLLQHTKTQPINKNNIPSSIQAVKSNNDIKNISTLRTLMATPKVSAVTVTKIQHLTKDQTKKDKIKIVKNNRVEITDSQLVKAYQNYQHGKMTKARLLYQNILQNNDENRDALLGLAAIAVHYRQTIRATAYYKTLLSLNPRDQAAISGLLSLNGFNSRSQTLITIKQLVRQQNASASLFFLLGNLHAAKQSWPEAQAAYFQAWNRNNTSPDYAYNLAVSLDSLNKGYSALKYYRIAQKLSTARTARFNRSALGQRIRELSKREPRLTR